MQHTDLPVYVAYTILHEILHIDWVNMLELSNLNRDVKIKYRKLPEGQEVDEKIGYRDIRLPLNLLHSPKVTGAWPPSNDTIVARRVLQLYVFQSQGDPRLPFGNATQPEASSKPQLSPSSTKAQKTERSETLEIQANTNTPAQVRSVDLTDFLSLILSLREPYSDKESRINALLSKQIGTSSHPLPVTTTTSEVPTGTEVPNLARRAPAPIEPPTTAIKEAQIAATPPMTDPPKVKTRITLISFEMIIDQDT